MTHSDPCQDALQALARLEGAPAGWAPPSWPDLARAARDNGMAPLLYSHLRQQPDDIPPGLLTWLQREYHQSVARNILLLKELEELASSFESAGVPLVVLKGAALLCTDRVPVAQRPITDLDLLVQPSQASAARALLERLGYRPQADWAQGFTESYLGERAYYKAGDRTLVADLHWHLLNHKGHEAWERRVWDRLRPCAVGEATLGLLSPEDELLHAALHLVCHHGGRGLLWRRDIALLTAGETNIRWTQVLSDARALRAVGALRLALKLARPLGARVPEEVLRSLAQQRATVDERVFLALILDPRFHRPASILRSWLALRGWRAKARFLRGRMRPQPEFAVQAAEAGTPLTRWEPLRRSGMVAVFCLKAGGRILRAVFSRRLPGL